MNWIIGGVCATIVAGLAYWKNSLTLSGALAAVVLGTIYYGVGNLFWFGTLLLFFMTSSLFSRAWRARKREAEQSYDKKGARDAGQVWANGGLGMLLCLGHAIAPHPLWSVAFIGVMATVTADTWATEWGSLSPTPPRSVLTWKPLEPGTSGGVSMLGTFAAAAGGACIGLGAALFASWGGALDTLPASISSGEATALRATLSSGEATALRATLSSGEATALRATLSSGEATALRATLSSGEATALRATLGSGEGTTLRTMLSWTLIGLVAGAAGAFVDSYLGATVQRMYRCSRCGRTVEAREHCQQAATRQRGWSWMSNDAVNGVSSFVGGCIAVLLALLLPFL